MFSNLDGIITVTKQILNKSLSNGAALQNAGMGMGWRLLGSIFEQEYQLFNSVVDSTEKAKRTGSSLPRKGIGTGWMPAPRRFGTSKRRKMPFSSEMATGAEDVSPALAEGIDRETASLLWGNGRRRKEGKRLESIAYN
jgi:hypothetical protein